MLEKEDVKIIEREWEDPLMLEKENEKQWCSSIATCKNVAGKKREKSKTVREKGLQF